MKKKTLLPIGVDTLLLVWTLLLFLVIRYIAQPSILQVQHKIVDSPDWIASTHPAVWQNQDAYTYVNVNVFMPIIHPVTMQFFPNDCLDNLWVNEREVRSDQFPFCHHTEGRSVNLHSYVQRGENSIHMLIQNHGKSGGASVAFPWNDPIFLFLDLCILILSVCIIRNILRLKKHAQKNIHLLWIIIAGGILLRFIYVLVTGYLLRGHDVHGHIEYMQHIATHWTIPLTKDGWQFYQPPLYYIITGFWVFISSALGIAKLTTIAGLQYFSAAVSVLTLCIGAFLGNTLLFPKKKQSTERYIYIALLAVFPSFVFFSGRINNDVLVVLWMLLSFVFLLQWWKSLQHLKWILSILFIILGILTKSNALLLVPALFACLALHKKIQWRQKMILGIIGALLIALCTGWHFYMRFSVEKNVSVVANITHLNRVLSVDDSVKSISIFNPVSIIHQPYNNPFSSDARRDLFWEYLFRGSLFGEFQFANIPILLSSIISLCALLLFPLTWIGVWKSAKERFFESAPILFALLFPLLGHFMYRQSAPFSTSQDFRYSMFIIFPLFYFLIYGLNMLPKPLQKIARILLYVFIGSCTLFLLSLGL